MSNSMTDRKYTIFSEEWDESEIVLLNNPLSSDLGVMRPALIFSGLENAAYNLNRQQSNLKLFEFGNVYRVKGDSFKEEEHLSITVTGQAISDKWRVADLDADWYELKATFEQILARLGIDSSKLGSSETAIDWFKFGLDWKKGDKVIASGGAISDDLKKKFEIRKEVYFIEIRWRDLVKMRQREINIGQLPKYPEVRRDLALLVDNGIEYSKLEELAFQTERKLLKSVSLFDVYQGKGMPEGKKSYGLAFNLRDDNKTLTDHEVDKTMKRLFERFNREAGAELR
tara:strand:- start:782 stop:1636 length:855 start_codon:yes stop_codon:yes gene_type:complete